MKNIVLTKVYIVDNINYDPILDDLVATTKESVGEPSKEPLPSDEELRVMKDDIFIEKINNAYRSEIDEIKDPVVLDKIVKLTHWEHRLSPDQIKKLKTIYNIPDTSLRGDIETLQAIIDSFKNCKNIKLIPRGNETNKTEWFKERYHLSDNDLGKLITYVQPSDFDKCLRSTRGDIFGHALIIFTPKHPISFDNINVNDPALYIKIDYEDSNLIGILSIHGEAENIKARQKRDERRNRKSDASSSTNIEASTYSGDVRQFWFKKITQALTGKTAAIDVTCYNYDDYSSDFKGSILFSFPNIACSFQLDIMDYNLIHSVDDIVYIVNFLYKNIIKYNWVSIVRDGEILAIELSTTSQCISYLEDTDDELQYHTFGNWRDNLLDLFVAIDDSL